MSPVRCRLKSSMGTIWAYPPPAAPPLMPNVGPCEGWRMTVKTRLPRCAPSAWHRPTVVVVLPSPSGVGVMAVTSMYLPLGRFFRRSRISSLTLALYGPYSSSSFGRMPSSSAICMIGFSLASCAIAISDGTGRRNLILVGTKPRIFLVGASLRTAALWETAFLTASFALPLPPLGDLLTFTPDLTAIFAPLSQNSVQLCVILHKIDKGRMSHFSSKLVTFDQCSKLLTLERPLDVTGF